MSGPKITVTLDASAVAGILVATKGVQDAAQDKGLSELVDQMRSMRQAIEGGLRAHGWRPVGDGSWTPSAGGRRGR